MAVLARIFSWKGGQPVLETVPSAPRGTASTRASVEPQAPRPEGRPPRHFRPDPSVMYLPRPYAEATFEPQHPALAQIAECLRARSTRLEQKWGLLSAWVGASELEYAKRLCRRLDRKRWRLNLARFCDALLRAQFDRPSRWRERDARLPATWSHQPWFYLDPRRSGRSSLDAIERELKGVRALGFANVALLSNVGPDIAAGGTARLERFMERTDTLGLRVAVGVDFSIFGNPGCWWAPPDLADPDMLQRIFNTLGRESNLGVLGTRTHGVDHWFDARHAEQTHALHALIKLFLKKLTARDIVMPEVASGTNLIEYVGGGVSVRGEKTTTEGDLLHWRSGMDALRASLASCDKQPIEDALASRPRLLHGAGLTCSLEHHDDVDRPRIDTLLGHDGDRIALAYAVLYALGTIPVVYAPAMAADAPTVLETLNRQPAPIGAVSVHHAPKRVCLWRRGSRWFAANLGREPTRVPATSDRPAIALPSYGYQWV